MKYIFKSQRVFDHFDNAIVAHIVDTVNQLGGAALYKKWRQVHKTKDIACHESVNKFMR